MKVPEYENDPQWLRYLESERLRVRREMLDTNPSKARAKHLQVEIDDIDSNIQIVQTRIRSKSSN